MDIQEIFAVLRIGETKDEGLIREAYRRLLTGVNPEDDPEGFKRLREAYEEAVAYAGALEEGGGICEADWMQNGPVGEFLQRVADVYGTLPRRLDIDEWKALVEEPVLQSLDDGEAAKWGMFSYLAENYRLPCRIWRLLDGVFFIEENQQEFKEQLPEGFVDYILHKIHDEKGSSDFLYEKFRGASDGDYDGFINQLLSLMNEQDDGTPAWRRKMEEKFETLASFGIIHPWQDLERAKYLFRIGEKEEAKRIVRILLRENEGEERICLTSAGILLKCGHTDEACELYKDYLSRENRTDYGTYTALYHLAGIEADGENWEKARELAQNAKELRGTDEVYGLLKEVNEKLIEQYTARADELTGREAGILGWCFVDAERGREGISFFEAHPEYPEDTGKWHKLLTALYRADGQMQAARKEVRLWRQYLEESLEGEVAKAEDCADADKERQKLNWELALSYRIEGDAFRGLFCQRAEEESQEAQKLYDQAIKAYDQAVGLVPDDTEFRMQRVLLLKDKGEYRRVVDECEEILKLDSRHFWACAYMQEAYKELRMGQEVVDTFYRAKEIYAGNPEIYLRAVRVFTSYEQYTDALGILNQAEEVGVDGYHPLILERMRVMYYLEEDEEGWKAAKNYMDQAIRRLEEEKAEDKILAKAYLRRAYLYEDSKKKRKKRLGKAKKDGKRALKLQDTIEIRYYLGRSYLKYHNKPKKAYKHLKICEERGMDFEWMYFYIAQCHEKFHEWDQAIEYYKKVSEQEPEFKDSYWRIGWLYRRKFARTEQKEYAEQALRYINLQQEKFGDGDQPYRWRGNIYMRLREYEKALNEVDKGLESDPDSGMWSLKAHILRYTGRYEEAIQCYENSIRAEDRYGEDDESCYRNIFQCFLRKKRLEEGISYFEKELEQELSEEVREKCLKNLADLEAEAGQYERALLWLEKRYGSVKFDRRCCDSWEREADRIEDVLDIWQDFQLYPGEELEEMLREAAALAKEACRDEEGDLEGRALMCHNVGEGYYYYGDHEKSLEFFEKALALAQRAEHYEHYQGLWRCLTRACYWLGDLEKAGEYGKEYRKLLEKTYEECSDLGLSMEELMTRDCWVSRSKIYQLFCWAYYTGQGEKARRYVKLAEEREMCYWCDEDGCTELWEMKGFLALLDQEKEKALEYFEKARRFCWLGGNKDAGMMIRSLSALPERQEGAPAF